MERATAAQVLGVDVSATPEEIREAFRRRAREVHPDTSGGDAAGMVELNKAYETLTAQPGPDWRFATASMGEPWVAPADPLGEVLPTQAGGASLLRLFGIALVVVGVVMTAIVFIAAIGYDWSVSP